MFRNRLNSQKPSDDLYSTFKATFPHLTAQNFPPADSASGSTAVSDALVTSRNARQVSEQQDVKDLAPTPRGISEPWRFTPSILDPNAFTFDSFVNEPPGYYTPTPGGMHTLYHSQAGDLHTPNMFGIGTPLSLPTSEANIQAGHVADMNALAYHAHSMPVQNFPSHAPFNQLQAFPPHQFSRQTSGFDQTNANGEEPSLDEYIEADMQDQSPIMTFSSHACDGSMLPPPVQCLDKFRYHVTLNAPTAMIKHPNEIPVTYLNKGQAYTVSISDTAPEHSPGTPVKYRTSIRISFEDEHQRQKPGACWQLWKEGRGTNEAHHRGGRLQAVEFVDPNQGCDDPNRRPRIELQTASFDGFSVTWTPSSTGSPECSVAVRFNFLSTDFSHSKGVKGIPVRLCAKTEVVSMHSPSHFRGVASEICYCKVKLFRDHGAERKLSNDVQHIKKTIDKLKQQIVQVESGAKDFGKRKRSGSMAKLPACSRPSKVPKHKRAWSTSSTGSNGGSRPLGEEDLHMKLASLQDMFTSTRPASILHLRGAEQDDPDLHPVRLIGEPLDLTKVDTTESHGWEQQSAQTTSASSTVSPAPSATPNQSPACRTTSIQQPSPVKLPSRESSNEWRAAPQTAVVDIQPTNPQHLASPPDQPVKMRKVQSEGDGNMACWIEALGVDYSYQPPAERVLKPVACFFVQPRIAGKQPPASYHRAIYLMQRTLKDLINGIALKCEVDPTRVVRTLRINSKGLNILVDDEVIRELPEGQDLVAEFHNVEGESPILKTDWDGHAAAHEIQCDGDVSVTENVPSKGYELRLLY